MVKTNYDLDLSDIIDQDTFISDLHKLISRYFYSNIMCDELILECKRLNHFDSSSTIEFNLKWR